MGAGLGKERRSRRGAVALAAVVMVVAVQAAGISPAWAGPGDITTVAGGPGSGPALSVGQQPVALAASGSRIWLLDRHGGSDFALRIIDTNTGQESVPLAFFGAGPLPSPHPHDPSVAVDDAGDLFVAYESGLGYGVVDEVLPSGETRWVAGGGNLLTSHADGIPATAEALNTINGIAIDGRGNVFLAENTWQDDDTTATIVDSRIRKVSPGGTITTVAGTGRPGYSGDGGPARLARLNAPMGLVTAPGGALYIADTGNSRVRRITTSGTITTVVGGGTSTADGVPATIAAISTSSIAYDSLGLVVEDDATHRIRRVTSGRISTVAGSGTCGWTGDEGPAVAAAICPSAIAASGDGSLSFVQRTDGMPQYGVAVLRGIDSGGAVHHVAGTGWITYGGDGGPALAAQFDTAPRLARGADGSTYVTDSSDHRLRRIDPSGTITTFAGNGVFADAGDGGPAIAASFRSVTDVAIAPDGTVYVDDAVASRIRRIDASGIITTVAGSGVWGGGGDGGPATDARLDWPVGLAFDAAGDLLFGDYRTVRRVDGQGIITTVAGGGSGGDGGPATAAALGEVQDVVTDGAGSMYIATDKYGSRVRRVDPAGTITTVAGGGGSTADGVPATDEQLNADALAFDGSGNLLIVEWSRVRRLEPDGTITTVAGVGSGDSDGDGGPATAAHLEGASDAVLDGSGNLLIGCTDIHLPYFGSGAVREVTAPF